MKHVILTIVIGLAFGTTAVAQDAATRSVREAMVADANALLTSMQQGGGIEEMLGVSRAGNLALELDSEQRENWQFWPAQRVGLSLELMSGAQRKIVHDLLTTVLSSNGYLKVVHIMQLEQVLDMLDSAGLPRSVDHYVLVFFGTPSMDAPWAWRFEGHHVSLNIAVAPDGISVTPSFLGSNPAEILAGPLAGFRVHGVNEDLGRELVTSLSEPQRSRAIVSDQAPGEIFTGNIRKERSQWNAWRESLTPQGVAVSDLNEVQQHWVRRILDEVVGNYRPEVSTAVLQSIDPAELSFAWMGATERGEPHYFRLQGSDFVFEYDNVQNMGNHVHSVWRSKAGDFGEDILERHYQSAHR